ncbi:MAG: hypothetical protein ACFE0I_16490 [Elainellaceae cyanobacterium]
MFPLNTEEQTILESVELGERQSVPDVVQEIKRYQSDAQAQVDALETVNIELPASDVQALREVALKSGVSLSLLMATVLHQFVAGCQEGN